MIDRKCGIVCDAKSGVSGAGRKPSLKTSFCEVTENFSPYSMLKHRHVPEVLLTSGLDEAEFSFTAQLIPIDRGILETIYFRLAQPLSAPKSLPSTKSGMRNEPFVRLYEAGHVPDLHAVAAHELLRHRRDCRRGVRPLRGGQRDRQSGQRRGGPGDSESESRIGLRGNGGWLL